MGGILVGAMLGATMLMLMSPQTRGGMMDMAGNRLGKMWRRGRREMMDMLPEGAR